MNAHKGLGLLGIVLSRQKRESSAFRIVDKNETQEDSRPYAYLGDHDRLTLHLSDGDMLTMGEQGVQLHMSWSSKLRDDGLGEPFSSSSSTHSEN